MVVAMAGFYYRPSVYGTSMVNYHWGKGCCFFYLLNSLLGISEVLVGINCSYGRPRAVQHVNLEVLPTLVQRCSPSST